MYKFEIYQTGKLPPLTIVEAECYEVNYDLKRIKFTVADEIVAIFNWNNIAGFKIVTEGEEDG